MAQCSENPRCFNATISDPQVQNSPEFSTSTTARIVSARLQNQVRHPKQQQHHERHGAVTESRIWIAMSLWESPDVYEPTFTGAAAGATRWDDERGSIRKDEFNGFKVDLLFSVAGAMRSGDLHKCSQLDFVFTGRVRVITREHGEDVKREYGPNSFISIPPATPHLFLFLEDTHMAEWWDGEFRVWYFRPYRVQVEASRCILRYYQAVNAGSVEGMLGECSAGVEVTFPDASRNWSTVEVARTKFTGMFQSLKGMHAEIAFESCECVGTSVVLSWRAHFTAEGYDAHRRMVYTVTDGKIARIEHHDVSDTDTES